MILKKTIHACKAYLIMAIFILILYIGLDETILFILSFILAMLAVVLEWSGAYESSRVIALIQDGKLQEFEKYILKLDDRSRIPLVRVPYLITMSKYQFAIGNPEQSLATLRTLALESEHKRNRIFQAYRKAILMELMLELLVMGQKEEAKQVRFQYDRTISSRIKMIKLEEKHKQEVLLRFFDLVMDEENDHASTCWKLELVLEDQMSFAVRLYLMYILKQSFMSDQAEKRIRYELTLTRYQDRLPLLGYLARQSEVKPL